jgi:hypothetical protein
MLRLLVVDQTGMAFDFCCVLQVTAPGTYVFPLQEVHSSAASISVNSTAAPPRSRPPPRVASFGSLRGLYNAAAAQNSSSSGIGTRPRTRSAFDSSTDPTDELLSSTALLEEDELLEERTVLNSGSDDARCLSWSSLESAAAAPASTGTAAAHRHQQQQQQEQQRYTTSSRSAVTATTGASHLALVVVVARSNSSCSGSSAKAASDSSSSSSSSSGGTTVLLRSNVSILNDTPAPALIDTYRTGAASLQTLAPSARAALPLPLLVRRSLRVRADGTHAWDAPIKLTPALLNPTTPSALRRTQALEANSLHLRCTPHDNSSTDAVTAVTAAIGSASDSARLTSPVRDRSRSTAVGSLDVADVQHRGRSASASGPSSRTASPTQVHSLLHSLHLNASCSLARVRIKFLVIKLCLLFLWTFASMAQIDQLLLHSISYVLYVISCVYCRIVDRHRLLVASLLALQQQPWLPAVTLLQQH